MIVAPLGSPSSVVVTGAILSHDDDGVRRSPAPRSREARVGRPSSRHNEPASIMRAMGVRVHVGTGDGLWELDGDRACPVEWLSGKSLTALAGDGPRTWAIVGGRMLCESAGVLWEERAAIEGPPATCLMPTPAGLLVGTEQAHLLRLTVDGLVPVESFDFTEGRDEWYTPWGDPADVRSIASATDAVLVSAATGPRGRRSALYRKRLDGDGPFERCRDGLPTWFDGNIDTACLAAAGPVVVFGTEDGCVFQSLDAGERWRILVKGLPPVTCLLLG